MEGTGRRMCPVENQTFRAETVALDDKHFINCTFENCVLTYDGGYFAWNNTRFIGFCPIQFGETAQRVIVFLNNFGLIRTDRQLGVSGSTVPSGEVH